MRRRIIAVALAAACFVFGGSILPPSHAAFPGRNGKIAFSSFRQIHVMGPDGNGKHRLTSSRRNRMPTWSADGSLIAYMCRRDSSWELCLIQADGTFLRRLTNDAAYDQYPTFSPDGDRLAFVKVTEGVGAIYVMDLATSDAEAIQVPALANCTEWSPDGNWILFERLGDLYKIRPDGTDESNITNSDLRETCPSWSPDGERIAFSGSKEGWNIHVMDADGTDVRQLTDGRHATAPAWSPDGTKICFNGYTKVAPDGGLDGYEKIMTINSDGADFTVLTPRNKRGYYTCDWQPR